MTVCWWPGLRSLGASVVGGRVRARLIWHNYSRCAVDSRIRPFRNTRKSLRLTSIYNPHFTSRDTSRVMAEPSLLTLNAPHERERGNYSRLQLHTSPRL